MSSQLTKVVAELRPAVGVREQTEGSENGLVDLGGPPSVELSSGVQQHFHQPNYAGVVYFDAGDFGFTGNNGEREPLKQRKVHVNVQRFRLETSKAIGNGDESLAHCFQVVQPFFETQVFETIDADLQAKEGRELFVHAANQAFAVNPQHMMTVVQFVEETVELAAHSPGHANAEDSGHLVGGQTEQAHLAGALEYFVDREVAPEDEVPAVFNLVDGTAKLILGDEELLDRFSA